MITAGVHKHNDDINEAVFLGHKNPQTKNGFNKQNDYIIVILFVDYRPYKLEGTLGLLKSKQMWLPM